MSYSIVTRHSDGTTSREHRDYTKYPACPPVTDQKAADRRADIFSGLKETKSQLRDAKGFSKGKKGRLVARIPVEVYNHVFRNEGREAAHDIKYLIRKSQELGIDPVVCKGRF